MDINDIKSITPINDQLVKLVYGDSVTGDSLIPCKSGHKTIQDMWMDGKLLMSADDKERVSSKELTLGMDGKWHEISYVMRHKTIKPIYEVSTSTGKHVKLTGDHSCMIFDGTKYVAKKTKDIKIGDVVLLETLKQDKVSEVKLLGEFDDYVYDISIRTDNRDEHVFFADGILAKNTDSLYISYDNLLQTIEGIENWDDKKKAEFIATLNTGFLNDYNTEVMKEHYASRHCKSMEQLFELETINLSGIWLNVKKRYAQVLLWKDGKYFDLDDLPMKVKGLEIIKSSYPKIARSSLKTLTRTLLENDGPMLIHKLNQEMQRAVCAFNAAPLEEICPTSSVNNYDKYVINDEGPDSLILQKGTPFVVRAVALYNSYIKKYGYKDNLSYGGKHRWYVIKELKKKKDPDNYFAFEPGMYPDWAEERCPVDRKAMFERTILEPFNRILEPIGMPTLRYDGSIQASLF